MEMEDPLDQTENILNELHPSKKNQLRLQLKDCKVSLELRLEEIKQLRSQLDAKDVKIKQLQQERIQPNQKNFIDLQHKIDQMEQQVLMRDAKVKNLLMQGDTLTYQKQLKLKDQKIRELSHELEVLIDQMPK